MKEKPTGQFSVGGGFSTLDKLVAIADITEGNLGGNGWMGRVRGQLGQRGQIGLITFRNPYLNDSLTSMQLDVYRSMTNYITYFEKKSGASMTLGRWLSEYTCGSVSLFAEQLNFNDPTGAFVRTSFLWSVANLETNRRPGFGPHSLATPETTI